MQSMLDPSTPRASAQKASKNSSQISSQTKISVFASPRPYRPLCPLRTPYLPTPSPSPLSSTMSTTSIAHSNSCYFTVDAFEKVSVRIHDSSPPLSETFFTPPHTPFSLKEGHPSPPPPYDVGLTTAHNNEDAVARFLGDLGLDAENLDYPSTGSEVTSGRVQYEAFKQTRSRVIRVSHPVLACYALLLMNITDPIS